MRALVVATPDQERKSQAAMVSAISTIKDGDAPDRTNLRQVGPDKTASSLRDDIRRPVVTSAMENRPGDRR